MVSSSTKAITNLFLYDTGAEIHVTNNLNWLHNYTEAEPTSISTGDSTSTIFGHGEIIFLSEQSPSKPILILKKVAYCPGFHTNIICGDTLYEAGIKLDQEQSQLVYRRTGKTFIDLVKHGKLHFLKAQPQEALNLYPSVYAVNSRKRHKHLGTKKVWHQRMGHCDMESINNLPFAAEGVTLVEPPTRAPPSQYGHPLCEPCVMARLQSQTSHRPPTIPARTPFVRIHFDVIIMEGHQGYGGAACIAKSEP